MDERDVPGLQRKVQIAARDSQCDPLPTLGKIKHALSGNPPMHDTSENEIRERKTDQTEEKEGSWAYVRIY